MKYLLTIICLAFLTTMASAQKTPMKKTAKDSVIVSKKQVKKDSVVASKKTIKKAASDAEELNAGKFRKQPVSKQKPPEKLFMKDTAQ